MTATVDLGAIFRARMDSAIAESGALAAAAIPLLEQVAVLSASAVAQRLAGTPNAELESDLALVAERVRLAGGHVAMRQFMAGISDAIGVLQVVVAGA